MKKINKKYLKLLDRKCKKRNILKFLAWPKRREIPILIRCVCLFKCKDFKNAHKVVFFAVKLIK